MTESKKKGSSTQPVTVSTSGDSSTPVQFVACSTDRGSDVVTVRLRVCVFCEHAAPVSSWRHGRCPVCGSSAGDLLKRRSTGGNDGIG